MRRDYRITLVCSEDEYQQIKARAGRVALSRYLKDLALRPADERANPLELKREAHFVEAVEHGARTTLAAVSPRSQRGQSSCKHGAKWGLCKFGCAKPRSGGQR